MNTITIKNGWDENVTATRGELISFKADIEQQAVVKEIRIGWNGRDAQVRVDIEHGDENYRGDNVWLELKTCWN
jgi:hypothetical protein